MTVGRIVLTPEGQSIVDESAIVVGCTWITDPVTPVIFCQSGGVMSRTGVGLYRFTLTNPIPVLAFPQPFFPFIANVSDAGSAFCGLATSIIPPATLLFFDFAVKDALGVLVDVGAFTFLLMQQGS